MRPAERLTAEATPTLLEVRDVSKSLGGVQAVSHVSLDVRPGEILSVIGPNGAGKTSLLNMISGFYHPDSGSIVLEGRDVTDLAPNRVAALGVARTFQNIALFRGMTVLDNLMLGRHVRMRTGVLGAFVYWGLAQKEEVVHRQRVEDIIDFLKIQDLRKRPTGSLAYGLQKMKEMGIVDGGDAARLGIGIITEARMKQTWDMMVQNKLVDTSKVKFNDAWTDRFVKDAKVMP